MVTFKYTALFVFKLKKRMKKLFVSFVIVMFLFSISGVIAQETSKDFSIFINDVVKTKGIDSNEITDVKELDFADLPDKVNLQNIDINNLGLYQIDVTGKEPVYVITLSNTSYTNLLKTSKEKSQYKRAYLNFGYSGKMDNSGFLQTATGVEGSIEKGYVMPRDGSITAISTNLDVTKENAEGKLEIIIYKNGESIGFGNTIIPLENGVLTDYDIQSENTVSFNAGDVISVYINETDKISWSDVITIVEVSTKN